MVRSRIVSGIKRRLGFVLIAPLLVLGMYQTYVIGGVAKVEKTGQITSYSATGGEDGDLKKGVACRLCHMNYFIPKVGENH